MIRGIAVKTSKGSKRPTTKPQIQPENERLFWDKVHTYKRLTNSLKQTAADVDFVRDVESATRLALQGTGLFCDWQRLVNEDIWPESRVRMRIIRLCASVYRKRGLQPDWYLERRASRSLCSTWTESSVRSGGSYRRCGVLEKNSRVLCMEHGVQAVADYIKNPDGNILRLECGCDRGEDISAAVPVRGTVSIATRPPTTEAVLQLADSCNPHSAPIHLWCWIGEQPLSHGERPLSIVERIRRSKSALSAKQLAEVMGCAESNITKKAKAGKIPCYRFGGSIKFDPVVTADWLENQAMGKAA